MGELHVEYIHVGVLLGFIQDVVIEALMAHTELSFQQKVALIRALSKVIWIQNDLFARWYVRDGEEYGDGAGRQKAGTVGGSSTSGSLASLSEDDRSSSKSNSTASSYSGMPRRVLESKIFGRAFRR